VGTNSIKMTIAAALCFAAVSASFTLGNEPETVRVTLSSGRTFYGRFVGYDDGSFRISATVKGETKTYSIPQKMIKEIEFGAAQPIARSDRTPEPVAATGVGKLRELFAEKIELSEPDVGDIKLFLDIIIGWARSTTKHTELISLIRSVTHGGESFMDPFCAKLLTYAALLHGDKALSAQVFRKRNFTSRLSVEHALLWRYVHDEQTAQAAVKNLKRSIDRLAGQVALEKSGKPADSRPPVRTQHTTERKTLKPRMLEYVLLVLRRVERALTEKGNQPALEEAMMLVMTVALHIPGGTDAMVAKFETLQKNYSTDKRRTAIINAFIYASYARGRQFDNAVEFYSKNLKNVQNPVVNRLLQMVSMVNKDFVPKANNIFTANSLGPLPRPRTPESFGKKVTGKAARDAGMRKPVSLKNWR